MNNIQLPSFVIKIANSFFILYDDNLVLSVSEEKAESLMNNNSIPLKQLNYRHQLEDKNLYNKIKNHEI
jgi:hypothetical protein